MPSSRQFHRNPPGPISPAMTPKHLADPRDQLPIPHASPRLLPAPPGVESRSADLQQPTHRRSREPLHDHQLIDAGVHVPHPSRPKMANAFFKMSRSCSTRRSSASSSRTRPSRPTAAAPPWRIASRFQLYSRLGLDQPQSLTDRSGRMAVKEHLHRLRLELLGVLPPILLAFPQTSRLRFRHRPALLEPSRISQPTVRKT